MGFSSYDCKHCDHPALCAQAANEGINGWMKHMVVLAKNGSRVMIEFDGYSGHVGESLDLPYGETVWVHQACWEVAGKPEFDAYDGPSRSSDDQGWFFDDGDHDLIDPRIKDDAERARLLAEGVERRTQARYTQRARDVHEWFDKEESEYHRELHGDQMWKLRWTARNEILRDGDGEIVRDGRRPKYDENLWRLDDKLDVSAEPQFKGTEDELNAHMNAEWARFRESDECAAYVAHREAEIAKYRAEQHEKFKAEGRYEVSRGPAPSGDTIKTEGERDWTGSRSIYRVEDRLTYETVVEMDGPDKALGVKTFIADKERTEKGYASVEWEARIEDVRAAGRESRRLAEEEAQRLNDKWAADGYPGRPWGDDA